MQHELERSGEAGLQRRQAHLAVALHRMAVAAGEVCARHEYRQIERGADEELLVVQVAAEFARLDRTCRARSSAAAPPP